MTDNGDERRRTQENRSASHAKHASIQTTTTKESDNGNATHTVHPEANHSPRDALDRKNNHGLN